MPNSSDMENSRSKTALLVEPELIERNPEILEKSHRDFEYVMLSSSLNRLIRSRAIAKFPISSVFAQATECGRITEFKDLQELLGKQEKSGFARVMRIDSLDSILLLHATDNGWKTCKFIDYEIDRKTLRQIRIFRSVGIAIVFSCIFVTGNPYVLTYLLGAFHTSVALMFIIVLGVVLFAFRCRARRLYGLLEVVFGIATAVLIVFPVTFDVQTYLQAMAGLYIIVRGLDNLDQGGMQDKKLWSRLFPSPKLNSPRPDQQPL